MLTNRWNDKECAAANGADAALASQAYASRLIGTEPELALNGGGNTSVKGDVVDRTGAKHRALFIKASGKDLGRMGAGDFVALSLKHLQRLEKLDCLTDEQMAEEFSLHMLRPHPSRASIETLLHAFLPFPFITHTHPTAVLALTDRENGEAVTREALGDDVAVIEYARVGLDLAKAAAETVRSKQPKRGLVIMHHGLVTWGESAREAYDATIEIVNRAEQYCDKRRSAVVRRALAGEETIRRLYATVAPIIRGLLCAAGRDSGDGNPGIVLHHLLDKNVRAVIDSADGRAICETPPLTPDLIVRAGIKPLWLESPSFNIPADFRAQFQTALAQYREAYIEYVKRHDSSVLQRLPPRASLPRVICIPSLGVICAGDDADRAAVAADIARQAVLAKAWIAESGGKYKAIAEEHLFDMEFRSLQRAKVDRAPQPLSGKVAIVTGSAGAIGQGIASALCENGCHVALADLPREALRAQAESYRREWGARVLEVAMDVTDAQSVADGFAKIVAQWGGVDIVIANAGIAHVSSLIDMDLEAFRRLERVNVDGTLLTLREAGRHFRQQQIGGDIVLVSTKNVFAPGAKFGAYSATKAGAHQLARIAVVEMAEMGVRVNMVSPDAVFSHGAVKSGLWATVGPDRMKARGLDEKGLEEYYQSRNLLKAQVTARHVANAVLFFVTRQTPTTGATLPVDGGLPDATPR